MSFPSIPQDVAADDFFPPGTVPVVAELADGTRPAQRVELPNIHATDRRLQGCRVQILVSDLLPEDPPETLCTLNETGQQWRLWRIWLRRPHVPLLGELRYEIGWGWVEVTYHPTWTGWRATPEEFAELSRGLAYLQQVIPRPGRPAGMLAESVGSFDDLPTFLQHVDQAITHLRTLHQEPTALIMARRLNLSVRTFDRGLERAGLKWNDVKRTGIPESVKIFFRIL